MNCNRVNGTIDKVVGSVKRGVGNLTGNTPLQVKGKLENALGKVQDAIDEASLEANPPQNTRL